MSHPAFTPLLPVLGKTWRGEFASSTPEKPVVDIARWELALNGQAVRILHSINDGEYGGETLLVWDAAAQELVYFYFTTAGFQTRGRLTAGPDGWTTVEGVTGNQSGITEVRAVTELLPDGDMRVRSEYFRNGEWVPGRETLYREAPGAQVKFKEG
jgi:hypothetical protein